MISASYKPCTHGNTHALNQEGGLTEEVLCDGAARRWLPIIVAQPEATVIGLDAIPDAPAGDEAGGKRGSRK